jgi:hypothetical protein
LIAPSERAVIEYGDRICYLIDIGNTISIPQPDFPLSISPNILTLRPGEESRVVVEVKSNYFLPAKISLGIPYIGAASRNVNSTFVPDEMSLPALGTASSSLYVQVTKDSRPAQVMLPIYTNISFPSPISLSGITESPISSSSLTTLLSLENLTVTVLPPLSFAERFGEFYETFSIPPEFIAAFYGIVLTALIGWLVPSLSRWYKGWSQGKYVRECMRMVIDASKQKSLENLEKAKDDIAVKYADGKISESHYKILNEKILEGVERAKEPQ